MHGSMCAQPNVVAIRRGDGSIEKTIIPFLQLRMAIHKREGTGLAVVDRGAVHAILRSRIHLEVTVIERRRVLINEYKTVGCAHRGKIGWFFEFSVVAASKPLGNQHLRGGSANEIVP